MFSHAPSLPPRIPQFHSRFDYHDRDQETYGKTGCRRVTPGQFLAADPNGRALMIGALEKQKLVYVMNRDASERLTISSPLEAHKAKNILFDVVGIDVGFENPVFACLELDYADVDIDPSGEALAESEKYLTFYELDLGMSFCASGRGWHSCTFIVVGVAVAFSFVAPPHVDESLPPKSCRPN